MFRKLNKIRRKRWEGMKREEIEQTMEEINKRIKRMCEQAGNIGREVYLLSLALKELDSVRANRR